jgi:hypothetical protein
MVVLMTAPATGSVSGVSGGSAISFASWAHARAGGRVSGGYNTTVKTRLEPSFPRGGGSFFRIRSPSSDVTDSKAWLTRSERSALRYPLSLR